MEKIVLYVLCFLGLIVAVWLVLGRGSALFCIFVGAISALSVFIEYWFGGLIAALVSCTLIISLPVALWARKKKLHSTGAMRAAKRGGKTSK